MNLKKLRGWVIFKAESLIRVINKNKIHHTATAALDPYMAIDGNKSLLLNNIYNKDSALKFLEYRILHNPNDLRSHAQRIYILIRKNSSGEIAGALIDLFITLGIKGKSLKVNLLSQAEKYLDSSSLIFFNKHISREIDPNNEEAQLFNGALFIKKNMQFMPLVLANRTKECAAPKNPLDEALDFIMNGQLEQAINLLENSLLENPDQPEVASELRELYKKINGATTREPNTP